MANRPPMQDFSNTGPPSLPPTNRTTPDSGFGNGADSDMSKKIPPPGFVNQSHGPHGGYITHPGNNGNQYYGPMSHVNDSVANGPPKQQPVHHMSGSFEDQMGGPPHNAPHQTQPGQYYATPQQMSMNGPPVQQNPYEYSQHQMPQGYVPMHPGMRGGTGPVMIGPGPSVSQGGVTGVSSGYGGSEGDSNANSQMHHPYPPHNFQQQPHGNYPPQQSQQQAGMGMYVAQAGQHGQTPMGGSHPQMVPQGPQMMQMQMVHQGVPVQSPQSNGMIPALIQGPNGQVQQVFVPANQQNHMMRQQQMGVVAQGNGPNGYLQFTDTSSFVPPGGLMYRPAMNKGPNLHGGPNSQVGPDGESSQQHMHSSGPPSAMSLPGSHSSGMSHPPPQQGQSPIALMQMHFPHQQIHNNRPMMVTNQSMPYYAPHGMVPVQYPPQGGQFVSLSQPQPYPYPGPGLNRSRNHGGNRSFRGGNGSFKRNNSDKDRDTSSSIDATPQRSQTQTPASDESGQNRENTDRLDNITNMNLKEDSLKNEKVDGMNLCDNVGEISPNRRSPKEMLQLVEKPLTPCHERESLSLEENLKEELFVIKECPSVEPVYLDLEQIRSKEMYCSYCLYVGKPDADKHVLRDQNQTCAHFTTEYNCRNCGSHGHVEMKCPTKVRESFLESQRKLGYSIDLDKETERREFRDNRGGYNKPHDHRAVGTFQNGDMGGFNRHNQHQGSYRHKEFKSRDSMRGQHRGHPRQS